MDLKKKSIFLFFPAGFVFSETEHSALEQFEGGPCAVIAPVQVNKYNIFDSVMEMNMNTCF